MTNEQNASNEIIQNKAELWADIEKYTSSENLKATIAAFEAAVAAARQAEEGCVGIISVEVANIRSSPSTTSNINIQQPNGANLLLDGMNVQSDGIWYRSALGWVRDDVIEVDSCGDALPVVSDPDEIAPVSLPGNDNVMVLNDLGVTEGQLAIWGRILANVNIGGTWTASDLQEAARIADELGSYGIAFTAGPQERYWTLSEMKTIQEFVNIAIVSLDAQYRADPVIQGNIIINYNYTPLLTSGNETNVTERVQRIIDEQLQQMAQLLGVPVEAVPFVLTFLGGGAWPIDVRGDARSTLSLPNQKCIDACKMEAILRESDDETDKRTARCRLGIPREGEECPDDRRDLVGGTVTHCGEAKTACPLVLAWSDGPQQTSPNAGITFTAGAFFEGTSSTKIDSDRGFSSSQLVAHEFGHQIWYRYEICLRSEGFTLPGDPGGPDYSSEGFGFVAASSRGGEEWFADLIANGIYDTFENTEEGRKLQQQYQEVMQIINQIDEQERANGCSQ